MKIININDLRKVDRFKGAELITSASGIKPATLVGSISTKGITNLAVFSSIVHLGSNPAYIGVVVRPQTSRRSDTYLNVKETKLFTINQFTKDIIYKGHKTSTKVDSSVSEFEYAGLEEQYIDDFKPPFVKKSKLKIALKYDHEIKLINRCTLVVGRVMFIAVDDVDTDIADGSLDLENLEAIGVDGSGSYYSIKKKESHKYSAKLNN
ncbi:MAG: hypothetical protein CBD58_04025 [bacterium TMED198]|nr:MAG: hypothetical protein CBD58_04025 [bacterium TMED198]